MTHFLKERESNQMMKKLIFLLPLLMVLLPALVSASPTYFRDITITNTGAETLVAGSTSYIRLDTTNTTAFSPAEVTLWNNASGMWLEINRVNITRFNNLTTDIRFQVQSDLNAGQSSNQTASWYRIYYDDPTPGTPKGNWSQVFIGGEGSFSGCSGNTTGTCGWTFFGSPSQGYMTIQNGLLYWEGMARSSVTGLYAGFPESITKRSNYKSNFTLSIYDEGGPRTGTCFGATSALTMDDCNGLTNGTWVGFFTDGGGTQRIDEVTKVEGASAGASQSGAIAGLYNLSCGLTKFKGAINATCFRQDGTLHASFQNILNAQNDDYFVNYIYPLMNYDDGFGTGPNSGSLDNVFFQLNSQNGEDALGVLGPQSPLIVTDVEPMFVAGTNTTNSTMHNTVARLSAEWLDDFGMTNYTVSYNNGSGFVNSSVLAITGTDNFTIYDVLLPNFNTTVQYKFFVRDISSNTAVSQTFSFVTTNGNNPPTYAANSTNSTTALSTVRHNLQLLDDVALSSYIFQYQGVNDSSVGISGTSFALNVTKTAPALETFVTWKVFITDGIGQSSVFTGTYTTTGYGAPSIVTNSPANTTYTAAVLINVTASNADPTPLSLFYSLDNGANTSFTDKVTTITPANGVHTIKTIAFNTLGEVGISGITFFTMNVSAAPAPPSVTGNALADIAYNTGITILILVIALGVTFLLYNAFLVDTKGMKPLDKIFYIILMFFGTILILSFAVGMF